LAAGDVLRDEAVRKQEGDAAGDAGINAQDWRGAARRCRGGAGRAMNTALALASLSTSLGATAGRGSGAYNICAGHGSCARLLAADGPKLGQGRRPGVGIRAPDERLATELHGAQSAGAYLLIRRFTADPVGITKVFERQSRRIHF